MSSRYFLRLSLVVLALLLTLSHQTLQIQGQTRRPQTRRPKATPPPAEKPAPTDSEQKHEEKPPFLVTARIYQARVKSTDLGDVTGQVFRLRTAGLSDEEKWGNAFQKVYPGFELSLLQSSPLRVYRSSRATRLIIGASGPRALESLLSGAYSVGDGKTPGTALLVETNLNFGRPEALSLDIQTIEVEDGMTYFFTIPRLRINAEDYVRFIRPGAPHRLFENDTFLLVFAYSVELKPAPETARVLDEAQSAEIAAAATRKTEPVVPEDLKQKQLSGTVRTRIEISPEGRVTHAYIVSSTFPEMNEASIAAIRSWEFPPTLFAADKRPLSVSVRFDFGLKK